tara:strand:+ start:37 stop:921 length:885 start_codon:yes stop_codon:yes gene_type:complete
MKNTHIEHPEDTILTGDLSVLDAFVTKSKLSVKIDGAPAIVWGTDPSNNQFFVGTKSVFNKFKIKINHNHTDIDRNHQGKVADILHKCLDYLPFTTSIYQGDFIGFGGTDSFNPNTIRYSFPTEISEEIIIAPHTVYDTPRGTLKDAVASSLDDELESVEGEVLFVKPEAQYDITDNIKQKCAFAKQIAQLVEFVDDKTATRLKRAMNKRIREGIKIESDRGKGNLLSFWKLVRSIKLDLLAECYSDAQYECYIENEIVPDEGYVMWSDIGTYKLVDRDQFSRANFNLSKFAKG